MELEISIESRDKNIESELTETKIAEGVSIHIKSHILREIVEIPEIVTFVVYIGEKVALSVAATLLARFLYDKLKERKDNKLTIENTLVEIDAQEIKKVIIELLKRERELEKYREGFWLDRNTFIKADKVRIQMVGRKKVGDRLVRSENAQMLILTEAIEMIVDDKGKILGLGKYSGLGLWLETVRKAMKNQKMAEEKL